MIRIPAYTSKDVARKIWRAGFVLKRHAKGLHDIFFNPDNNRMISIPIHPGETIPIGTIHAIIRATGLTTEEFIVL